MSVSADPKSLGYVVENGVIIIATRDSLPAKRKARVYDVTDLAGRPANYFSPLMGFGGMMPGMGYGGMMPGMGLGGMGMGYGRGFGGMMPGMSMPFGGMMPGMPMRGLGMGAYGGMGYGGYGGAYGGYGGLGGYGGYGGYGYGGQPYGLGGRSFITGGYIPRIGSIPIGTSLSVSPYISGNYVIGSYGFNRGQELADLIDTLYGPSRRTRRNR